MIPTPLPDWWPEHLEVSDAYVDVSALDPRLRNFLVEATDVHWQQFSKPLVITSGNDGNHAPGSKHYSWKAVDLRSHDITPDQQNMFAVAIVMLQPKYKVGVFDERFIGKPCWHVEVA